mmetsp:Transcript_104377/g.185603  ORF Transcript_104377/g.185603 Transcript_104377/m.185603 type:complete len:676 (-) Transcript_104377:184-2211(-)
MLERGLVRKQLGFYATDNFHMQIREAEGKKGHAVRCALTQKVISQSYFLCFLAERIQQACPLHWACAISWQQQQRHFKGKSRQDEQIQGDSGTNLAAELASESLEAVQQAKNVVPHALGTAALTTGLPRTSEKYVIFDEREGRPPALFLAAQEGDIWCLNQLLEAKADVDKATARNASSCFIAAQLGQVRALKALLRAEADVDKATAAQATPILVAAHQGHLHAVQLLLRAKASVNIKTKKNVSPALLATLGGRLPILQALLLASADVNTCDESSHMFATKAATIVGHAKMLKLLLQAKGDVDGDVAEASSDSECLVLIAARAGHLRILQMLVEAHASVDTGMGSHTPASVVVERGDTGMLQILMTAKANTGLCSQNAHKFPLCLAASYRFHRVLKMLIRAKADVDAKGNANATPAVLACECGNCVGIRALARGGADILEPFGRSPCGTASFRGHAEVLHELLGQEIDINRSLLNGNTPTLLAALSTSTASLALLVVAKATFDKDSSQNMMDIVMAAQEVHSHMVAVLMVAVGFSSNKTEMEKLLYRSTWAGHESVVRLLLQMEANVHMCYRGHPTICMAVEAGHVNMMEILLKGEADINLCFHGMTLLKIAARRGHIETCNALLEYNVDVDRQEHGSLQPGCNGTAFQVAKRCGHFELQHILSKLSEVEFIEFG